VVSGKTSKRKNIAFTLEAKQKTLISLENFYQDFDNYLKSCL